MRQFLDHGLNIIKLHGYYQNQCVEDEVIGVSLRVFMNIFNNLYNISTRYV